MFFYTFLKPPGGGLKKLGKNVTAASSHRNNRGNATVRS